MIHLTTPTAKYRESYISGLKELKAEGRVKTYDVSQAENDFDGFLQMLYDFDDVSKIPEGYVPCVRLWLMDGEEYVGNVTIRRWLNEGIYLSGHVGYEVVPSKRGKGYGHKALEKAIEWINEHDMNMDPLLIACDEDNLKSRLVIEGRGGRVVEKRKLDNGIVRLIHKVPR